MLKWSRKFFNKSEFLSRATLLISGTVIGQIILFMALPILTRIYSPEQMGVLGVGSMLIMIGATVACLRLELTIPLPRSDKVAVQLLAVSILFCSLFASLVAGVLLLLDQYFDRLHFITGLKPYIWIVPLGIWATAAYSTLQFWFVRKARIRAVASTQLTRSAAAASSQITLGLLGFGVLGLLVGHLIYTLAGSFELLRRVFLLDAKLIMKVSRRRMLRAVSSQRSYMAYSVPQSLLNTLSANGPLILIAAIVSTREAGFLLLAIRICAIPVGLIGGSLSRVYLAEAAIKHRNGQLREFSYAIMGNLAKIGLLLFLPLGLLAPLLFPYIFGAEWDRAGQMVSWLAPAMFFQFICSPVSTAFVVLKKMNVSLYIHIYSILIIFSSIIFSWINYENYIFEFFAVSLSFYYALYLYISISIIRKS